MARTRAPKPAAEEARPAAVGKLLALTILRGKAESLGSEESLDSRSDRSWRSADRHAWVRGLVTSSAEPLRIRVSDPEYLSDAEAVVSVRSDFWDSVTLSEELVGKLSFVSRLPQYLIWINIGLSLCARSKRSLADLLNDSNIDWCCCAGPVYLGFLHFRHGCRILEVELDLFLRHGEEFRSFFSLFQIFRKSGEVQAGSSEQHPRLSREDG